MLSEDTEQHDAVFLQQGSENTGFSHPEVQLQRQHQQQLQKQQTVRKVTLTKGAQQHRLQQQRQQSVPQLLGMANNLASQQNRVSMCTFQMLEMPYVVLIKEVQSIRSPQPQRQ